MTDEYEPTPEQQEANFRAVYGDAAWKALKAESGRLGRKLTMDEAAKVLEGNHVYGYSPDLPEMGIRLKRDAQRRREMGEPFSVEDAVDILRGLLANSEDRVTPLLENCTKCYELALTDAIIKINQKREESIL